MANQPATGTIFQITISSVPTNIKNSGISAFGSIKAVIDNTALEASAKTFLDDVPDPGNITTQVYIDHSATVTAYLQTAANTTGQVDAFTVSPSGTTKKYTFNGFVMKFQPVMMKGQAQMADLEVKLTGPITYA